MVLPDESLGLLDDHALVIGGHGHEAGVVLAHGLNRAQERGAFAQDHVAGIDQRLQKQVEGLGAALHRQQVVRRAVDLRRAQEFGGALPQRGEAVGGAVLQKRGSVFLQHLGRQRGDDLRLQRAVGRIAARKRDHARPGQQLEDFADGAAGDGTHVLCKHLFGKLHRLSLQQKTPSPPREGDLRTLYHFHSPQTPAASSRAFTGAPGPDYSVPPTGSGMYSADGPTRPRTIRTLSWLRPSGLLLPIIAIYEEIIPHPVLSVKRSFFPVLL